MQSDNTTTETVVATNPQADNPEADATDTAHTPDTAELGTATAQLGKNTADSADAKPKRQSGGSSKRKQRSSRKRASKPATSSDDKQADAANAKPAKPEPSKHDIADSYAARGGASPCIRGHGRKLSAVRTDIGAANVTPRDERFIADIASKYGGRQFRRYDCDAGALRRAIAHGFIEHVSGDLGSRDATFRATKRGVEYGRSASK